MAQVAHVLIGGGTGFVGRHLVKCLKSSGAKVRIISRKVPQARSSSQNQDYISWTKIKEDGVPKETTAIVNLAGRNILDPVIWTETFKREVYDSRIETNKLLVKLIHKSPSKELKAFVTISGVGYYEPSENKEYNEDWKQSSGTSSGDYLMNLARDWEQAGELDEKLVPSIRRVILRSGVVIGHDGGIIKNAKLPFSLGLGGPIGSGTQWFPWIHVEDLANMIKFSILNDNVKGIINAVAPEQVRSKDFATSFGRALNRPAVIPMPSFAVNLMFGSERAKILLKGQRVSSRSTNLGFKYQYPTIQEACNESVKQRN